jgi:hypothetical protein
MRRKVSELGGQCQQGWTTKSDDSVTAFRCEHVADPDGARLCREPITSNLLVALRTGLGRYLSG